MFVDSKIGNGKCGVKILKWMFFGDKRSSTYPDLKHSVKEDEQRGGKYDHSDSERQYLEVTCTITPPCISQH